MGLLQVTAPHTTGTLQKLIDGVQYSYDRELDIIFVGEMQRSEPFDRTQVPAPVDLCIELTTACNFACGNCFSRSWRGLPGVHADLEAVQREINNARAGIIRVCITGGEPTLHPDFEQMVSLPSLYSDLGFVLSTNGAARTGMLGAISEHPWLVAVSLHGTEQVHNRYTRSRAFQRVVRQIQRITASNTVHLYCVLNDYMSEEDVEWLVRFRAESGAAFLRFIEPRPFGRHVALTRSNLIEIVRQRVGERIGLKRTASVTTFLSATFDRRRTN